MNIKGILRHKGIDITLDQNGAILKDIYRYRKPRRVKLYVLDVAGIAASQGLQSHAWNPLMEFDQTKNNANLVSSAVLSGCLLKEEIDHWTEMLRFILSSIVIHSVHCEPEDKQNLVHAFLHPDGICQSAILNRNLHDSDNVMNKIRNRTIHQDLMEALETIETMAPMEYDTISAMTGRAINWINCPSLGISQTRSDFRLSDFKSDRKTYQKVFVLLPKYLTEAQKRWLWMFLHMAIKILRGWYVPDRDSASIHLGEYSYYLKGHEIFEKTSI